jgi:hypothetical protein
MAFNKSMQCSFRLADNVNEATARFVSSHNNNNKSAVSLPWYIGVVSVIINIVMKTTGGLLANETKFGRKHLTWE